MEKEAYNDLINLSDTHYWFKFKRDISLYLISKYKKSNMKDLDVLEIGCGSGGNIKHLSKYFNTMDGIEYDKEMVDYCNSTLPNDIKNGYLPYNMPVVDKKYDVILLLDVLEHIQDDENSLIEIKKLLKDDGIVIINVPAFKWLWDNGDDIAMHMRRYNKAMLLKLVKLSQYNILSFSYNTFLLFPAVVLVKFLNKLFSNKYKNTSNINRFSSMNDLLYIVYKIELLFLKIFKKLPIGAWLHLVLINKKCKYIN